MTHSPASIGQIAAVALLGLLAALGAHAPARAQGATVVAGTAAAAEPVTGPAVAPAAAGTAMSVEAMAVAPDAGPVGDAAEASAEEDPFIWVNSADVALDSFLWERRPVVVFADTPSDPALIDQVEFLRGSWPELDARDVVVIIDANPDIRSAVRQRLRPRGFSLVVMDKDGAVAQRKPLPWVGREVIGAIDRMPMRRDEIRQGAR